MRLRKAPGDAVATAGRSLTASAAVIPVTELADPSWHFHRFRDERWQKELWRLYDLIGEFRFYANWVGSNMSRARLYIAQVDRLGRLGPEEEKDSRVAALSDTLFGGPGQKAECLRLLGIDLAVAGEAYILGQSVAAEERDEWHILAASEMKKYQDGLWWGDRRDLQPIVPGRDLLARVWTPHPARTWQADCSARAVMPLLRELEQLTKYVFSQIDSRLFGAGLLPIPTGMDFPDPDVDASPEEAALSAADSLMMRLAKAGAASMQGEGTAAGVLPVIAEFPMEALGKINLVSFASQLSKEALELRAEAIRRLGLGLDMSPETLKGMGESTTHWSSYQIDASQIKVHIEPPLTRICDAVTKAYVQPALKAMGKNPNRWCVWWDASPLTVRPQRLTDALNLHKEGLVSAKAVRQAGFFAEHDAPQDEETVTRFLKELILRDPTLFAVPAVREIIGISAEMLPPESATPPPPPPVPETGIQSQVPAAQPNEVGMAPPQSPTEHASQRNSSPKALAASAASARPSVALVVAADAAVLRAMELAGSRLLTRAHRGRFPDTPKHELHSVIAENVDSARAQRLLDGAWTHLAATLDHLAANVDAAELQTLLTSYCTVLLTGKHLHEPDRLLELLRRARMVDLDGGA